MLIFFICIAVFFIVWWFRPRPQPRIWSYWPDPLSLDPYKRLSSVAAGVTLLTDQTVQGMLMLPPTFHAVVFGRHRKALIMLCTLAEHGGVWIDDPRVIPSWQLRGEYEEGTGWRAAQRGGFMAAWRDEFLEMIRYASVEDYVTDRSKAVDLSHIADPLETPELVAREKVLQYDRYPREGLKGL